MRSAFIAFGGVSHVFLMSTLILYSLGMAFYICFFYSQRERIERVANMAMWAGLLAHSLLLVDSYLILDRFPVIDLRESLSFFSWSLVVLYLIARGFYGLRSAGVFVTPLALGLIISSAFLSRGAFQGDERFATLIFPFHIFSAFLGHATFALAFAAGLMYLLQERGLKRRRPGLLLKRLPSLEELDELGYRLVSVGFMLLTLGIATGSFWLHSTDGYYLKWDPKITSSMVTWFFYAAILHARLTAGWRGRRTAIFAIIGFCSVLFTFLGAGFIRAGFHNFFF